MSVAKEKLRTETSARSAAQALRERVTGMIDRELSRCRTKLGDEAWQTHRDWIQAYLVTSAKEWLTQQARKGAL